MVIRLIKGHRDLLVCALCGDRKQVSSLLHVRLGDPQLHTCGEGWTLPAPIKAKARR